ncbi:hypothetical protein FA15DRAFT_658409 [Coprinopsis marcescibilis]|uniref:Uncharacterized protein n=1 Tax=Coprinopsis marcescibilis TaxID=230819 RepID=A0A5C3KLV8_COPMA|nr:hypothetical protein FA15DRAFT_658409 [Coprinopsis marcescibilis]
MNAFYDSDKARTLVDALIAKSEQEIDGYPHLTALNIQMKDMRVSEFAEPRTFRIVNNKAPSEEVFFRIIGILCSRHCHLYCRDRMSECMGLFKGNPGTEATTEPDYKPYEGDVAIDCHARYLTDRDLSPNEKHQPFGTDVDPHSILEAIRGSKFIHSADNRVEYCVKKQVSPDKYRYESIKPEEIKEGDIVEATVAVVNIPIREDQFKMILALRAITKITDEVRKAAEVQLRQQTGKEDATITSRYPSNNASPKPLKRKRLFANQDTEDTSKKARKDNTNM